MESLALAAAIIVLSIIVGGLVSLVVAWRRPKALWAKLSGSVFAVFALWGGGWLALIDVGNGARVIGAAVCALGVSALWRTWRRPAPDA